MRKLFKNIEIALLMFESWGSLYLAKTLDCFATNFLHVGKRYSRYTKCKMMFFFLD